MRQHTSQSHHPSNLPSASQAHAAHAHIQPPTWRGHARRDTLLRLALQQARSRIRLHHDAPHTRINQKHMMSTPTPPLTAALPPPPESGAGNAPSAKRSSCSWRNRERIRLWRRRRRCAAGAGSTRSGVAQWGQGRCGGCRAQRTMPQDEQMGAYSDKACTWADVVVEYIHNGWK